MALGFGDQDHARILDAGPGELGAHDAGDRTADDSGDDREDQIEGADVLVIRGHEPAREEARLVIGVMVRVRLVVGLERQSVGGNGAHLTLSALNYGPWRPGSWPVGG